MAFRARFWLTSELLLLLLLWVVLLARVDAEPHETQALLDFRDQYTLTYVGSIYWISWGVNDYSPCGWLGVTCTANNTVVQLDLSGWGFGGTLSLKLLSMLKDLRRLDLSSNYIEAIPDDVGHLTGLTWLDLSNNNIKYGIPGSIARCLNLTFLSLAKNSLSGEITNLGGLINLKFLMLFQNEFSGPFPKEIGKLRNLMILDLSDNSWYGILPVLPLLTNLVELKLDNNKFTGFEEPWSLINASKTLQHLSISNNQLQGQIPADIRHLDNLSVLDLSQNRLYGSIPPGPDGVLFASNAYSLDLSQNQLTGGISSDLFSYNLLNLSHNVLGGELSVQGATRLVYMTVLDLSFNNLSGPIPSAFGTPEFQIQTLCLQNNLLSGDIVEVFLGHPGLLMNLQNLQLQHNLFTGDLSKLANSSWNPQQFDTQRLWDLTRLDLSYNRLRWSTSVDVPQPIQATLQTLSSTTLQELRLAGIDALGTVLPTACFINQTLGMLQVMDLSNSHLEGLIMEAAFNISCLSRFRSLNLSGNDLFGPFPEIAVTLPRLAVLDVSNNHLLGSLPAFPLGSPLINPSFYTGNKGLCGYPLPLCGQHSRKIVMQWWELVVIGASLIVSMLSCAAVTWRWSVSLKRHQQDADLIKTLMERDSATLMALRDLKKATGNFAKSAQIGEGGFGTVYRGKLSDGTIVAIKRSKREGSEIDKQLFLNEVRILSHVSHRNLVKLLGCCMENKVAVLVFEFVANGTLQEHLRGKSKAHARLSWIQRLNIAVQAADALNYLHSAAKFPIYHRDVKSTNILLDEELNAKVADFGLSKLAPLQASHVSTMAVQGTMGYIDPEYCTSNQITAKSDVYSFGMVLLEILSAQPPIDFRRCEEEISLLTFAERHIESGNLHGFIDPALVETYNDPSGYGRESIMDVGRLAMRCLDARSKARPRMSKVLQELRNLWLEANESSRCFLSSGSEDEKLGHYCKSVLPEHLTITISR